MIMMMMQAARDLEAAEKARKEARREAKKKAEEEAKDGGDDKKPKASPKTGASKDAATKAQDQKGKEGKNSGVPYNLPSPLTPHDDQVLGTNVSRASTHANQSAAPICPATHARDFERQHDNRGVSASQVCTRSW